MGLVHTKLRNRLGNERVTKLEHVYRHFGWKHRLSEQSDEMRDIEEELEIVSTIC